MNPSSIAAPANDLQAPERYRDIVDYAPLGIFSSTVDGRILIANSAFCRMLGYDSVEEMQRLNLARDVYANAEERAALVAHKREARAPRTVELRFKQKDGTPIWVRLTAHAVRDAEGQIRYFESCVQDITDARLAQEQVQRALSLLTATLESTADGILVVDLAGNLVNCNGKFLEMWRLTAATAAVKDARVAHALEQVKDPEGFAAKIRELYASPDAESFDVIELKDRRIFERWSQPHRLGDACVGRVVSFRDVTAQRRGEEIKTRLLHHLISAQETERRRLARELHDETGQALTSLLVGLRSIEQMARLKRVRSAAEVLRGIAAATLENVGRLAQGLHPSLLDDLGLIPALTRYAREQATVHGLAIELKAGDPGAERLPMPVETTLYRVAQEAITNVARHAGARRVGLWLTRLPELVRLTVQDDGGGFDLAGERAARETGHLGLYGIRERVALVGGEVAIRSAPGQGTTITVEVPLGR